MKTCGSKLHLPVGHTPTTLGSKAQTVLERNIPGTGTKADSPLRVSEDGTPLALRRGPVGAGLRARPGSLHSTGQRHTARQRRPVTPRCPALLQGDVTQEMLRLHKGGDLHPPPVPQWTPEKLRRVGSRPREGADYGPEKPQCELSRGAQNPMLSPALSPGVNGVPGDKDKKHSWESMTSLQ